MSTFSRSLMRTARPQILRSSRLQSGGARISSVTPARSASSYSSSGRAGASSSLWSAGAAVTVAGVALWSMKTSPSKLRLEAAPSQGKRKSYAERMSTEGRAKKEEGKEEKPKKKEEREKEKEGERQDAPSSATHDEESPLDLDELSEEASQQSAFDPDTGTINWDCPCLGGMADGPCGEEFKEAFSCFVFSEADPKGIDCVEKFKAMQGCFRKYPEHYKEELEDDDEEGDEQKTGADVTSADEDEDEGVREWRSEMAKEGKA